jgi:hypothetical protein
MQKQRQRQEQEATATTTTSATNNRNRKSEIQRFFAALRMTNKDNVNCINNEQRQKQPFTAG